MTGVPPALVDATGAADTDAGVLGTVGTPAVTVALLALGTLLVMTAAAVLAGAGGAAFSLPHSIHNKVATISQAKIRKTRVWFMGGRQTQPTRAGGVASGGREASATESSDAQLPEAAGIVTGAGDSGNAAAVRTAA